MGHSTSIFTPLRWVGVAVHMFADARDTGHFLGVGNDKCGDNLSTIGTINLLLNASCNHVCSKVLAIFASEKTFHRDKTAYFLKERESVLTELNTPKSIGEKVGIITDIKRDYFCFEGAPLANGDGVIFVNEKGMVDGFRINKVEENKILDGFWNGN